MSNNFVIPASGLKKIAAGLWVSKKHTGPISYPEKGADYCMEVEEKSFWFQHRNQCICILAKKYLPAGEVIYDLGGGNGIVAIALQKAGFEPVLIEPVENAVQNARKRGLRKTICSTIENAEFEKNSLPAIGIFDVMEHIEDESEFLKSIHSALQPGGKLFITVPAYNFLWSKSDIESGHYRRYTLKQLEKKLAARGFKTLFSSYIFSSLVIPTLLWRTLPYKIGLQKTGSATKNIKLEHGVKDSLPVKLLKKFHRLEALRIAKSQKIPCGATCIMAAEKLAV